MITTLILRTNIEMQLRRASDIKLSATWEENPSFVRIPFSISFILSHLFLVHFFISGFSVCLKCLCFKCFKSIKEPKRVYIKWN